MDTLLNYQRNLRKEIESIHTVASISQEEYDNAYEVNNHIINEVVKCTDKKKYKKVFRKYINSIDFSEYDTEYREFLLSSLEKTAAIAGVHIGFILNVKLYSWPLAVLVSLFNRK